MGFQYVQLGYDLSVLSTVELRAEDAQEITTALGIADPYEALRYCVESSEEAFIVLKDRVPIVVFGYSEGETPNTGIEMVFPWMVATDAIQKFPKTLTKTARVFIKELLTTYAFAVNYVDSRNTLHIKWLEHLGFSFCYDLDRNIGGIPFHYFYKKREV